MSESNTITVSPLPPPNSIEYQTFKKQIEKVALHQINHWIDNDSSVTIVLNNNEIATKLVNDMDSSFVNGKMVRFKFALVYFYLM